MENICKAYFQKYAAVPRRWILAHKTKFNKWGEKKKRPNSILFFCIIVNNFQVLLWTRQLQKYNRKELYGCYINQYCSLLWKKTYPVMVISIFHTTQYWWSRTLCYLLLARISDFLENKIWTMYVFLTLDTFNLFLFFKSHTSDSCCQSFIFWRRNHTRCLFIKVNWVEVIMANSGSFF